MGDPLLQKPMEELFCLGVGGKVPVYGPLSQLLVCESSCRTLAPAPSDVPALLAPAEQRGVVLLCDGDAHVRAAVVGFVRPREGLPLIADVGAFADLPLGGQWLAAVAAYGGSGSPTGGLWCPPALPVVILTFAAFANVRVARLSRRRYFAMHVRALPANREQQCVVPPGLTVRVDWERQRGALEPAATVCCDSSVLVFVGWIICFALAVVGVAIAVTVLVGGAAADLVSIALFPLFAVWLLVWLYQTAGPGVGGSEEREVLF